MFQVVLVCVVLVLFTPGALVRMPVPTEKLTELFCDLPLMVLIIPLSYNLLLLLLCAIYGFLTRKLPENFNESWYIFISVWTTMLLWTVLLPTYFTTFYAYYQAALLSFCLVMNALVILMCLYAPKLYAIYFVPPEHLLTMLTTTHSVTIMPVK